MRYSSLPCMLHAPSISYTLIWSPEQYLAKRTSHEAPRYAVFCSLPPLPLSWVQIFSSAPCSQTPSIYIFNILDGSKSKSIHEEIKRRLNLWIACYSSFQNLLFSLLRSTYIKIRIYIKKSVFNCSFVCYEILSLTLKGEQKLRVSENKAMRIFGPKREKLAGYWIRLYNEELHYFYTSLNIIRAIKSRTMRRAGLLARMKEMRNA